MDVRKNQFNLTGNYLVLVHAVTLLANFMVSTSFPVGKEIAFAMEPGVLMLLRFVLAALVMGLFVHLHH